MLSEYFILASKNLRKRGLRSWLTMLGIFIGIAAVVSLISLSQGLEQAIVGQFSSLDPDKLIIENAGTGFGPPGSTAISPLVKHDVEIIEKTRGVENVIPRLIRIVKVEYNKEASFDYIASVPHDSEKIDIIVDALNVELSEGNFLKKEDKGKIVIGYDFTDENKFGKQVRLGANLNIQGEIFEVIGILEKGSTFQVNSVILMMEDDLRRIMDIEENIDIIVVQVENQKEIEEVAERIESELRRDRREKIGEETFSVQTPLQSISAISTILGIINIIVVGIASISILIGAIGIANTMFTSVLERRKEIGVMKAIGAKNSDILKIFVIESSLLGLIGGIVGVILGLLLAFGVSSLAGSFLGGITIQVRISVPLVISATLFSFLLGLLFGTFPAWQASKLNPVEALRK